jgi:hypothetical protein
VQRIHRQLMRVILYLPVVISKILSLYIIYLESKTYTINTGFLFFVLFVCFVFFLFFVSFSPGNTVHFFIEVLANLDKQQRKIEVCSRLLLQSTS